MSPRRFITGTRGGRPRRPMDWEYASATSAGVVGGTISAFQVVTSTELNAQYTDPTLMATIMLFSARLTADTSTGGFIVAGLIAWDDINDTVPTAAERPGPITNGNLDWILRIVFASPQGAPVPAVYTQTLDTFTRSKARRRLGSSRTLLACVEATTGMTYNYALDVRCLIKE